MIVCRIELWPQGDHEQARSLGNVVISNDGTGDQEFGNYNCVLTHAGRFSHQRGAYRAGRVEGHRRVGNLYGLIRAAVCACLATVRGGARYKSRALTERDHLVANQVREGLMQIREREQCPE